MIFLQNHQSIWLSIAPVTMQQLGNRSATCLAATCFDQSNCKTRHTYLTGQWKSIIKLQEMFFCCALTFLSIFQSILICILRIFSQVGSLVLAFFKMLRKQYLKVTKYHYFLNLIYSVCLQLTGLCPQTCITFQTAVINTENYFGFRQDVEWGSECKATLRWALRFLGKNNNQILSCPHIFQVIILQYSDVKMKGNFYIYWCGKNAQLETSPLTAQ